MNNKFVKKTVAVATSVATTISLSGISLLAPVFVAASSHIMDGDTIKTATSPDVWIAKHVGTKKFKRLILNPQVFESYGHLSWGAIKTVSATDAAMYTTSELVRAIGDPKVYKLTSAMNSDTGQKQWLNMTAAEFVAAGYDWDSIYEINTVDRDNYTVSSDVTPTVTPPVTPPVTTGYMAKLASSNPAAGTLVNNSAFNKVLTAEVWAGSAAMNVTSVTVERFGISQDSNVSGVSIWDASGMRHGNISTLGQRIAVISFPSDPIAIPAGGMTTVTVAINIASTGTSGTVGVKITGISGTPSGLPVMSNTFSLASGNSVLGAIEADINTQNTSQVTVNVGTTGQLLTKLSLGETSSNEDVWFKGVTFQQNGSAADEDVKNWKFVSPTGAVLATVTNSVGKVVKFDLSATPWKIDKGTTDVFDVKVDVVNGSNRTVQGVVQNDYNVDLLGSDTGIFLLPTADTTDTDDASFPIGDVTNEDTLSIGSGTLTAAKATNSPSGNVAAGATDITLAKWELKAEGEDFEVRNVDFYFGTLVAPDNGDSGTTANEPTDVLTGSVKLTKGDGASVYSAAVSATVPATTETAVTLTSYFTIKAGTTETLSAVGNLRSDLGAADSFQFALKDVYGRRLTTGDFSTQATAAVLANSLTGQTGSLSVVKNEAQGAVTVIGSTKTLLSSFTLQSGSAEGVNITSFAPDFDTGTANATDLDSWWLEIDGVKFGQTDSTPHVTSDSFTGTFQLPASSQAILNVYGDISSTVGNGETFIVDFAATDVSGTTLLSQQTVNNGTGATGQTMTLRTAGIVKVKVGTNPVTGMHHANEADVKVLEVKIDTLYEGVNISEMRFIELGNTQRDWTGVTLKKGTTVLGTRAPDANGIYDFTGLVESIDANKGATYTLEVDVTNALTLGAGDNAQIYFQSAEIKGKDSGSDILEYDGEGFGGAVTVELGSTSSATHYRQGDLVLSMDNAAADDPFGINQADENEATSTSASGLDLGFAATETFTTSEYIAKVGGTALARGPQIGAVLTGFVAGDLVVFSDASANTVISGIADTVTSGEPATIDGTAVTIDQAGDIVVGMAGARFAATVAVGADFTTAPAVGDLVYYFDASAAANSRWGVVTAYTNDAVGTADSIALDGEALDHTAASTTVAASDRYFGLTMDVTQEVYSTAAVNHYNVGDVVYHFDASADSDASAFAIVTTGVRAGETMANLVTSLATAAASDRIVRIAPLAIGTNTYKLHVAEPVGVANNSGISTTMSNSLQDIGRFDITAQGGDLTIESITLTVFGSGVDSMSTATNGLEIWVGGVREFQGGDLTPVAEAGTDFVIDFTNAIDIVSGQTKSFLVKANTLGITVTNETASVRLGGTKGQDASSIDFYYTTLGPGTAPTASAPEDINDSEFPLNGVTIIK